MQPTGYRLSKSLLVFLNISNNDLTQLSGIIIARGTTTSGATINLSSYKFTTVPIIVASLVNHSTSLAFLFDIRIASVTTTSALINCYYKNTDGTVSGAASEIINWIAIGS